MCVYVCVCVHKGGQGEGEGMGMGIIMHEVQGMLRHVMCSP